MENAIAIAQQIRNQLRHERILALLSSFFGALAMLPACIGLYGILSYVLARRTTKIGIRLALGALSRQAVTLVLGESAVMTILGLAVGITASFGFSQFGSSFLVCLQTTH